MEWGKDATRLNFANTVAQAASLRRWAGNSELRDQRSDPNFRIENPLRSQLLVSSELWPSHSKFPPFGSVSCTREPRGSILRLYHILPIMTSYRVQIAEKGLP